MRQIQDSSQRLLQAMDWPATTGGSGRHSPPQPQSSSTGSREPKQPLEVGQPRFSSRTMTSRHISKGGAEDALKAAFLWSSLHELHHWACPGKL